MRKAVIIGEEPTEKDTKGIEFTHILGMEGEWNSNGRHHNPTYMQSISAFNFNDVDSIFCCIDKEGQKLVFKGFLNNGQY